MKRLLSLVLVMVFVAMTTIGVEAKTQTRNERMASEYAIELEDEIYEELRDNEKINSIVKTYEVAYDDMGYGVYKWTATIKLEDKAKIELVFYKDLNDKYSDAIEYIVLDGKRVTEKELYKAYPEFKEDDNNK